MVWPVSLWLIETILFSDHPKVSIQRLHKIYSIYKEIKLPLSMKLILPIHNMPVNSNYDNFDLYYMNASKLQPSYNY
jgi:hypothetical protein